MDTSEKNFEATIEASLLRDPLSSGSKDVPALADAATGAYLRGGYRRREPTDYDKELCLIPKDVLDFIHATQPREWDKMQKQHGAEAKPPVTLGEKNQIEWSAVRALVRSRCSCFRLPTLGHDPFRKPDRHSAVSLQGTSERLHHIFN